MNIVEAIRSAWIREAEAALPDPQYREFVNFESWARAFHLREALMSRLLAERLREREPVHRADAPEPVPSGFMPGAEQGLRELAWSHRIVAGPGRGAPAEPKGAGVPRRRPLHTIVGPDRRPDDDVDGRGSR